LNILQRNTTYRTFAGTVLFILALAGSIHAQDTNRAIPAGIAVSIDVVRTDAANGTYTCTAHVTDIASGALLSSPKVAFTSETGAVVRTKKQPDPNRPASEVALDVLAGKDGNSASYSVSYTREGVLVAVQNGSLTLR